MCLCVFKQQCCCCCYWSPSSWSAQSPTAGPCQSAAGRPPAHLHGSRYPRPHSFSPPVNQSINQSSVHPSIHSSLVSKRSYNLFHSLSFCGGEHIDWLVKWLKSFVHLVCDQRETKDSHSTVSCYDNLRSGTHTWSTQHMKSMTYLQSWVDQWHVHLRSTCGTWA